MKADVANSLFDQCSITHGRSRTESLNCPVDQFPEVGFRFWSNDRAAP